MQLRVRGGGFQSSNSSDSSTPPIAAGVYQINEIMTGLEELNERFKICSKLIDDLKAQAESLERILNSNDDL